MKYGKFITLEGNDGCGKSTVAAAIVEKLKAEGYPVILTREPGGIAISEQIRQVILDPQNTSMDGRTEALLYAASRRQHLVEKVIPAINNGNIVICDRFLDSSLAYQGVARGLGIDNVLNINQFAIDDCMPALTIMLKIDPRLGLKRVAKRHQSDRLDAEALSFHLAVAKGYEAVSERYPERIKTVDATLPLNQVVSTVYQLIKEHLDNVC